MLDAGNATIQKPPPVTSATLFNVSAIAVPLPLSTTLSEAVGSPPEIVMFAIP